MTTDWTMSLKVGDKIDALFEILNSNVPEAPPIIFAEKIGKYRLKKQIGEGAFGVVYLAVDEDLDRQVAIKFSKYTTSNKKQFKEVIKEAKTLAMLEHDCIARIYDVGVDDDIAGGYKDPPSLLTKRFAVSQENAFLAPVRSGFDPTSLRLVF